MRQTETRSRFVRWLYYRLVWCRNLSAAMLRWLGNHLTALMRRASRWLYWRTVAASNYSKALGRWSLNHVAWLSRAIWNYARWLVRASWYRARLISSLLSLTWRRISSVLSTVPRTSLPTAPSARSLNTGLPFMTHRLAVVIHAHYLEVLPEILARIAQLIQTTGETPDLVVTTTSPPAEVTTLLQTFGLTGEVIGVDNHGRDVLPFLTLVNQGRLSGAHVILKLHTKVSSHRADGHAWRTSMIQTLTDANVVHAVLANALGGKEFITAPAAQILGTRDWGRNLKTTVRLARQLGIQRLPFRFRFPAGTMFWITRGLVEELRGLQITPEDFPAEPLPLDGSTAHAIERLFGVLAGTYGDGVLACEDL